MGEPWEMNQAVAGKAAVLASWAWKAESDEAGEVSVKAAGAGAGGVDMMFELQHQPHAPPLRPIACIIQP